MKPKQACAQGRRPSPEGTRLLIAGTISPPMISPFDGPTDRRHEKTKRTIQEWGRDTEKVLGMKLE